MVFMVESQAFSLFISILLILVGFPLLLFGVWQYSSSPAVGSSILAISVMMLILGGLFLLIMFTQK